VVKGNGADVVVENVGFDDAMKESAANESEFSVDGCSGTSNVVPAASGVVRKCWVGVLEISDSNEPVVNPEVRSEVPNCHVVESVGLAENSENADCDSNSEITQKNEFGIFGFVQRT